ncbi:hypothetical protein DYH09_12290 [bacterium CPR1]|nr:hypothetical protein [bacterium CPR1]
MLTLENPRAYRPGMHPIRPANWSAPRSSVQVLRLKTLRQSPLEDPRRQALERSKARIYSLLEQTRPQAEQGPAPSLRLSAVRAASARIFEAQIESHPHSALANEDNRQQAFRRAVTTVYDIQSGTQIVTRYGEPIADRRKNALNRARQSAFQAQGYCFPRTFMSRPENR